MIPPSATHLATSRTRAFALLAAVFIFFASAYTFTASGDIFSQGDTTIRIELAENILNHASFVMQGWKLQNPPHMKLEYYDPRVSLGVGGFTYSTYLLGQPLAIIPFDVLGQNLAQHEAWPFGPTVIWIDRLVGPLFGALEVTLFFLFAVRLGYGLRRSLALTLIFGFASSVWPDEQSVLEHTEVAFFLLWAAYLAFRFRDQGRGWWYPALAGFVLGGAAITRYQDAFLAGVALTFYFLWPGRRFRGWKPADFLPRIRAEILFGLGVLPSLLLDAWYDWVRFGSPLASGHHEKVFGYPIWLGAAGLVLSPGKGLLWFSPVIFLLIIALPRFRRRYPTLAVTFLLLPIIMVLLYGYVTYWHGDPAWGPRYIYPALPFLILPLGELLYRRGRRVRLVWTITALVVAISFTVQVAGVAVPEWRSWYRVIAYEEQHGRAWQWIASRYNYFWTPQESPLYFQLHGLYQLGYDNFLHSSKYEIVPPDEDATLMGMTTNYALNQWNFWWASNEFNWWMGQNKVIEGVLLLLGMMCASGTYVIAEAAGVFASEPSQTPIREKINEAA